MRGWMDGWVDGCLWPCFSGSQVQATLPEADGEDRCSGPLCSWCVSRALSQVEASPASGPSWEGATRVVSGFWPLLTTLLWTALEFCVKHNSFQFSWSTVTWFLGNSMFNWLRNCQALFQSIFTILSSHQQCMNFSTSHPLAVTCLLYYGHPKVWSSISLQVWLALFHVLIAHLHILSGEMSVQILGSFLIGLFVFLLLSCKCSFFSMNTRPSLDIWFANVFFHVVGCLYTFLVVSFAAGFLNVDEAQVIFVFFHCLFFWCDIYETVA
jgi:hypothetical protein